MSNCKTRDIVVVKTGSLCQANSINTILMCKLVVGSALAGSGDRGGRE